MRTIILFYLDSFKYKKFWIFISLCFTIFLFIVSITPQEYILKTGYPQISNLFDAINHFIGFFIFYLTLRAAFSYSFPLNKKTKNKFSNFLKKFNSLLFGIFWAVVCESVQFFIPSRGIQLLDYTANISGVLLSNFLLNILYKTFS